MVWRCRREGGGRRCPAHLHCPNTSPCAPAAPSPAHTQPDKSGQVSVERLARTLAAFDLRIDLDRLLVSGRWGPDQHPPGQWKW